MMVGKKHSRNIAKRNGASTRVENEFFLAGFDQRARSKAVETRRRRAAAEKSYAKSIVRGFRHILLLL
jgi:hypothetical protein